MRDECTAIELLLTLMLLMLMLIESALLLACVLIAVSPVGDEFEIF